MSACIAVFNFKCMSDEKKKIKCIMKRYQYTTDLSIILLFFCFRPQNTNVCGYGRWSTATTFNKNSFTFGSRIGSSPNPKTFSFNRWSVSNKYYILYFCNFSHSQFGHRPAIYFFVSLVTFWIKFLDVSAHFSLRTCSYSNK